jgi:biotin synthase
MQDRLDTLARVRDAGVKVCCGGIVGMGESRLQRAGLVAQLANLDPYPESVPINHLVPVEGTPLAHQAPLDPFEFVRTIAGGAHHHAARARAPVGRAASRWATRAGAVLPGRRQLHLLRRQAADQPATRSMPTWRLLQRLGPAAGSRNRGRTA